MANEQPNPDWLLASIPHRFIPMKPIHVPLVASGALFIALLPNLPYAYFQLVRWLVCGVSIYGIFMARQKSREGWMWTMVVMAVLFNPIAPIRFVRAAWQVLDFVSAILFICSLPVFRKKVELK